MSLTVVLWVINIPLGPRWMSLLRHPELEKTKITKKGQIHAHFNAREKCEKSLKNKSIP